MKKVHFLLPFLLFTSLYSNGQYSIGPSIGVNFYTANFQSNEPDTAAHFRNYFGSRMAYSVNPFIGVLQKYKFKNKELYVALDLQGVLKGFQIAENFPPSGGFQGVQSLYINIMPQVEYKPLKFLGVYAGGSVGIRMFSQLRENDAWIKATESVKPVEVGVFTGVRAYLKNFYLSTSFHYGLTDFDNLNYVDVNGQPVETKFNSYGFQVGLGYDFVVKNESRRTITPAF